MSTKWDSKLNENVDKTRMITNNTVDKPECGQCENEINKIMID